LLAHFLNFSSADLLIISEKIISISEIIEKKSYIVEHLKREIDKEKNFLVRTTKQLEKYCQENQEKIISGKTIFFWYDTKGMPYPLIEHFLNQKKKKFSSEKFYSLLAQQKELGKKNLQQKKIKTFSS
jgi:alanyl-tRNA synthetase